MKLTKRHMAAVFGMTFSLGLVVSAHGQVTLEPAGMQVVWKSLEKEFDGQKTYGESEGVHLTLAAMVKDKKFIGFFKKDSKVMFMDGDTELGGKFGFFDKLSKDGGVLKIVMKSDKLPAKVAASVRVKGSIAVMVASKSETKSIGPRALKKDDKLELGEDFKFTVDEIGKPKYGDDPLQIVFQWKRKTSGKVPELKEVRFYGEDGKLIESSRAGTSWSGFAGSYTTTMTFKLKKDSKALKVEMDLWTDAEKVTVPLDMGLKIGGKE